MATTTARNKNDADNMSTKERIWDSLNYSYGKKREESDKSFAKAYSQAVNQGLKTGMQRSSYGAQTLANIDNEKIKAQNDIYDQQIADYENRLYQIERDEAEDAWKQKQFDETQRQYNESLAFNKEQFGETKAQNAWNRTFQQSQADRSQANWEKEFGEAQTQNAWNRDFQQAQANLAQSNWEKEFGETQTQNAWNRTFQQTQADRSQSNWEKEFAETLAQNQWNREYMQDEFKYKYGLAGAGSGGSTGGGGGGNGGYTPAPNDDTGKERFDLATVAGASGIIDAGNLFGNALSLGLSNANPKNYSDLEKKQSSDTKKIGGVASGLSSGGSVSKSEKDKLNKNK